MIVNMVGARCRSAIDARIVGKFSAVAVGFPAGHGGLGQSKASQHRSAGREGRWGHGSAEQRFALRRIRDVVVCHAGS
jgi:hypothetical protein